MLCESCYAALPSARHQRTPGPVVKLRAPRPAKWPTWTEWRLQIWDQLARCGPVSYIAHDRVAGRCPRCGHGLGVRFHGQTLRADFVCHDGCDERAVVAALGGVHDDQ